MKNPSLTIALTFLSLALYAQSTSELINSANQLLTDGHDYPMAISNLETALASTDITSEQKVRANYCIADAKLRESQVQVSKLGNEVAPKYREYIFQSVDHLLYSRNNIGDSPELSSSIEQRINSVENLLTRHMMQLIREKDLRHGPERDAGLTILLRTCQAVQKLNPENYSAYDYQGQAELTKGDSAKALAALAKAVKLYESLELKEPDAYAGYMYYRLAMLHNNHLKDRPTAMNILMAGIETLKTDRTKLASLVQMKQIRMNTIQTRMAEVEDKIELFLVDLILREETTTPEQETLIEKTIAKHPDNDILIFQYAGKVAKNNPVKAREIYDGLIARDPTNADALYNAGVIIYNMAAEAGKDPTWLRKRDEHFLEDQMLIALGYFKRAVDLGQKAAINPILQIADYFGDKELHQQYSQMQ